MFRSEHSERLIARRVSRGYGEAQSRLLLDELLRTRGAGALASALHYDDFATAAGAEAFATAFLEDAGKNTPILRDEEHAGRVEIVGGRYPFRPACSCGEAFRGYVADHAAREVLEAHLRGEA